MNNQNDFKANANKHEIQIGTGVLMDRVIERGVIKKHQVSIVLFFLFTIVLVSSLYLFNRNPSVKIEKDELQLDSVVFEEFEEFIPLRAQIEPVNSVYISSIEGGRIAEVFVESGDLVKKGDPIVNLINSRLQLDLISRESEIADQFNNLGDLELRLEQNKLMHRRDLLEIDFKLERLEREIKEASSLVKSQFAPASMLKSMNEEIAYLKELKKFQLDAQKTDAELLTSHLKKIRENSNALNTNLDIVKKNLRSLNITAPFDGVLSSFDLVEGESLGANQAIGRIDDLSQYKTVAEIDEFYLSRIQKNQKAFVTIDGSDYELIVSKIHPDVTNSKVKIDLTFSGVIPNGLKSGQNIYANLHLSEKRKSTLIQNGAFLSETGGKWVFVLEKNGKYATKRKIVLGEKNPKHVEVIEGLVVGEIVIISSYSGFNDVDRIEFK